MTLNIVLVMVLERSVKTLDFVIFAFTAVLGLILILLFFWYNSSTSSKSSKVKFLGINII